MSQKRRVWITWETQRRSTELAKVLKCELYIFDEKDFFRYPMSLVKTLFILIKVKPSILFVQNPSMFLAAFSCIYCKVFTIPLVVDRHTTFMLDKTIKNIFKRKIFQVLHSFTIKNADITIVTNSHLAELVAQKKGNPFILPDPLPDIRSNKRSALRGKLSIMVPSSFRHDEPFDHMISAMNILSGEDMFFYITGNFKSLSSELKKNLPATAVLTGYLPEHEYTDLLYSVDAVMVLTTATSCMLCGCYEAITAEKPLITSNKPCLQEYFYDALFVDNSVEGIVTACRELALNRELLCQKSRNMKLAIAEKWAGYCNHLEEWLLQLNSKC